MKVLNKSKRYIRIFDALKNEYSITIDDLKKLLIKYNIKKESETLNKIAHVIYVEKQAGLPRNEKLLQDINKLDIPNRKQKSDRKSLKCLIYLYKRECIEENMELNNISTQPASQVRALREDGYIFIDNNRESLEFSYKNEDGKICRKITEFDKNKALKGSKKIDPKRGKKFKEGKVDPLTGTSHKLEVDHRKPTERYLLDGEILPDFSVEFDNGTADKHFQVLSNHTNNVKREACAICIAIGEIRIPPAFQNKGFKEKYDGSCVGCFWYNPLGENK